MRSHQNWQASMALLLATGIIFQGCMPHISSVKEQKYFHIPTSTVPWQQLTNGVDLHAWYQCYGGPDRKYPACISRNIDMIDRDTKPDFEIVPARPVLSWTENMNTTITPLSSAHSNTRRRIVGLASLHGRDDIYVLRGGLHELHSLNSKIEVIDIWHNAKPDCENAPKPMLVVMDERFLWIFAEQGSKCRTPVKDLYAPGDLIRFKENAGFSDMLRKPMQLFYLDREDRNASAFDGPRTVSTNAELLKYFPTEVVAFDSIYVPKNQIFTLEAGKFNYPLSHEPFPNLQCHYSETKFYMTIFEDTPNPKLTHCKPFAVKPK